MPSTAPTQKPAIPVEADDPAGGYFTAERTAQWIKTFLVIGLAARAIRYLLCFPLWEDECFLCVNFIDREFAGMLQPLQYHQVAPPLFLALELAATKLFGYSEWALRLIPFLCGLGSLFVFRSLASRFLSGGAFVLAFGMFAVAYPGIRYSAEAKQYSTDLVTALALLWLTVEWHRTGRTRYLAGLIAFAPAALWLSYPAMFVTGGMSLAIAASLLGNGRGVPGERVSMPRRLARSVAASLNRDRTAWLLWAAFNAAILAGFASVYFVIRRQSQVDLGFMADYWQTAFPPLTRPWKLPLWFVLTHTGDLMAWPVGGGNGASAATGMLAAIGVVQLVRGKSPFWITLLLAPAALNFVAAALHRYPYGGHFKFSMYLGPAVCLLAGWGAAAWNDWTRRGHARLAHNAAAVSALLLAFVGGAAIARDVAHPCKTLSDERARAFAQWFFFNAEAQGEVALVNGYEGREFSPDASKELTWTAMFLCNKAIYSPAGTRPPRIASDDTRPVRKLVYRDPRFAFDDAARDAWEAEMRREYAFVGKETYPFTRLGKGERELLSVDYLDIYTYQPRTPAVASEPPAARH